MIWEIDLNTAARLTWPFTRNCMHAPLQSDFATTPVSRWHLFSLPLNLVWPCDLLWWVECHNGDTVSATSLDAKRPYAPLLSWNFLCPVLEDNRLYAAETSRIVEAVNVQLTGQLTTDTRLSPAGTSRSTQPSPRQTFHPQNQEPNKWWWFLSLTIGGFCYAENRLIQSSKGSHIFS